MLILPDAIYPQEKQLRLDSSLGNPIDNGQYNEISDYELSQYSKIKTDNILHRRCEATARYNCHGMTFASRRTGIYESSVVAQVLKEDGYSEISQNKVLPGDVIVYYSDDGDAEHSGVVVSLPDGTFGIPQVMSKWGKYAEFIHWANQSPYSFAVVKYYRIII